MSITSVYRTNYKHKYKLKDIRHIVEEYLSYVFYVVYVSKTFCFKDKSNRVYNDYYLTSSELESMKEKVYMSYTIGIKKDVPLYMEHNFEGYIDLLNKFVEMSKELKKMGLCLIPNTIDDKMDFDIVENDSLTDILLDNYNINEFIEEIIYEYTTFEGRGYQLSCPTETSYFYVIRLESSYNSKNEHKNIENIKHFEEFLNNKCVKRGFKFIRNKTGSYNVYTKVQYRSINIKRILKK